MDFDDIISLVNQSIIAVRGKPLSDVQRIVLRGSWDNQTYTSIADLAVGYTEDYLKRDVGPKLWQALSDVTGYTVNKRNIRNALLQWATQYSAESPTANGSVNGATPGSTNDSRAAELDSATDWGSEGAIASSEQMFTERAIPRSSGRLTLCSALRVDVSEFSGRQNELAQLTQWIQDDHCRLVLLWGLPNMGKTTLTIKALGLLRDHFDHCGYLNLQADLSPKAFLQELTDWLIEGAPPGGVIAPPPSATWQEQMDWVIEQFSQRRCLLVVDSSEVLFEPNQLAGTYRPECLAYRSFLEQVARLMHQSCVLWIGRERPQEFASLQSRLVQCYELAEFSAAEARDFLMAQGWPAAEIEDWQRLIQRYSGCPQLLKSLTFNLQVIHSGSLDRFLEDPVSLPELERSPLLEVLGRLCRAEQELLYWLALAQEPMALADLSSSMVRPLATDELQSLLSRGLCRSVSSRQPTGVLLDLNPAVRILALEQIVQVLETELTGDRIDLFHHLPLLRVTASEAVQARQVQSVIEPLTQILEQRYPCETALEQWVQALHQKLRSHCLSQPSYGIGNLFHLCQALDISLGTFDFSNFWIWQANLQQLSLQGANLSQVRFQDTVFATALGRDLVVAFGPDGGTLAVGDHEGCLLLWEVQRGKLLRFSEDSNAKSIRSLAFSPQGDLLAVGSADGTVQLWLLGNTGQASDMLYAHQAPVQALAFSSEGDLLATGDEAGHLLVWDLSSGLPRQTLATSGYPIRGLEFSSAADRLISSSESQTVSLWQVDSGELAHSFQVQATAWVRSVGFMPKPANGDTAAAAEVPYAVGCDDACLYLWDVEQDQPVRIVPMELGAMPTIALSPDGRFLAYSRPDRSVVVWDVANRCHRHLLTGFDLPVWFLKFSPNSLQLATASDYTIKVWDVASGTCLRSLGSQRYTLQCLTFDGLSRLITGHDDTLLRSWQVNTAGAFARRPRSLRGHSGPIKAVAASAQGSWIASSSDDRTIRLWSTAARSEGSLSPTDTSKPTARGYRLLADDLITPATVMAFSPKGHWLSSGGEDALVRLWPLADEDAPLGVLEGHSGPITALAFCPDEQHLVSGSRDRTLRLWHLASGDCLQVMAGHQRQVHGVSISSDGSHLISISRDGTARWWHLVTGECQGQWQHPQGYWLHGCMSDRNGRLIAIASDTLTLELWSVTDSERLLELSGHTSEIWHVCVSPNQRYLATASQDEEIRIWRLDLGTCEQVLRPDRPYEGMNIRGAKGLSEPEEQMLRSLGALVGY